MWLIAVVLGCSTTPDWVDECGCGQLQTCVVDGADGAAPTCVETPNTCLQATFGTECGEAPSDACAEALCGGPPAGAFETECHSVGSDDGEPEVRVRADCDAEL